MKGSLYIKHPVHSLLRGGQRTILAVFCVAVGVMAIVALQLVGLMINNAFTSNVRDANGGDIAVTSTNQPFRPNDLAFFDKLKKNGSITNYTASIAASGSTSLNASLNQTFQVHIVDPQTFPIVTPPTFVKPIDSKMSTLLTNNRVVVTQSFASQYSKKVDDTLVVRMGSSTLPGRTLHVKIAGIVADAGIFAQAGSTMLVSLTDYHNAASSIPVLYDTINVATAHQADTDKAVKVIQTQFPIANTQTVADALKSQQSFVDFIKKFLEIAGLLALLIGGIGIVNTMQVLLSRRRIEIAMLKTVGYRRFDLYLLFGLEAGLLGLVGGIVGATVAVGVSYLVRNLVQQTFGLHIPFLLDPVTIGGGVLIGLCTALIFGLLPIVQAANIRPLNVIREIPEGKGIGSIFLTMSMVLLLSVLFCALAIVILNNDYTLGISAVYGALIFLGLLSIFFVLIVLLISILPVPERFSIGYFALVLVSAALSGGLFLLLPAFGGLLLAVSVLSFVIIFLPRSWKMNMKMALRNIGRQRARSVTTLLALFVGIFTIGVILVLGQDIRDKLNVSLANSLTYNVITTTSGNQTTALHSKLGTITGLSRQRQTMVAQTVPLAIDHTPIQSLLPASNTSAPSFGNLGRGGAFEFLSGVEGYDLAHKQVPDLQDMTITDGKNLNVSDAGTNHVLIAWQLVHLPPLQGHLKVGSTITFAGIDGKSTRNVTVVGVYRQTTNTSHLEPVLTTRETVTGLRSAGLGQDIFYMKVDSAKVSQAIASIGKIAPDAYVINLAKIGDYVNQILSYMILTLTTIASLSLLAAVIIIANAVALAMLERRRELGILKSVGYTSRSILSEVLIENGIIGGTGALLAMLLVTFATSLLGTFFFHTDFNVNSLIVIGLILGSALLAMLTATLVAWGAVRVRPLEVLRYE